MLLRLSPRGRRESLKGGATLRAGGTLASEPGEAAQAEQAVAKSAGHPDATDAFKLALSELQVILHGDRDPALADDPALDTMMRWN